MIQPIIAIVDYGVGNVYSVLTAVQALGYRKVKVTSSEADIDKAHALILPGVGAFDACARNLRDRNLDSILDTAVIVKQKPILGVCVGMQMMADFSEEHGRHRGLGWIPGQVVRLELPAPHVVPHVGWNDVNFAGSCPLFLNMPEKPSFYFDHSYHYRCDSEFVAARCGYGIDVVAAIQKENIFGVQFHPEISQNNGLRVFRRFLSVVKSC